MKLSKTVATTILLLWSGVLQSFSRNRNEHSMCQGAQQRSRSTRQTASAFESTCPRRKACGFYIWDAPSALLFRWCKHLQKDCIYEGRGGDRFVRVRPGSMLQLLYPCHRYSPDRCLLCGGCYKDHLILGWVKHLYKPFDRFLDKDFADSLVPAINKSQRKYSASDADIRRHAFHRRYVLDISNQIVDKKGNKLPYRERERILKQEFTQRFGSSRGPPVPVVSSNGALFLPDKSPEGKRPSVLIGLCRLLLINSVKSMYQLQLRDNAIACADSPSSHRRN